MSDNEALIGLGTGILTFLICWIACTVNYGFPGFALGWLPGLILGAIVGFVMAIGWKQFLGFLVWLIAALGLLIWFLSTR